VINLNEEQKDIVFNYSNGVIINASPGTGKTTTLVARALYKMESLPIYRKIALITYTNAGADEVSDRIGNQKSTFIGTIHSFCLEFILRPYAWIYDWGKKRVLSYDEQLVFLEQNEDIDLGRTPVDELNKINKNLDGSYIIDNEWEHEISIEELIDRYSEYLDEINVISFNEILYRSYKIIDENQFVVKALASKFYEILIDEFQDTNIFQYEILKKINTKRTTTFFMVGDEKQRILQFAGAIEDTFSSAINDFNLPLKYLLTSYRSTTNIVNAYSSIFDEHPEINNQSNNKDLNIKLVKKEFDYKHNTLDDNINNYVEHLVERLDIKLDEIAILSKSWFDAVNVSACLREKYNIVGLGALPHSMKNVKNSTFELIKGLAKFKLLSSLKNLKSLKRSFEAHLLEHDINFEEEEKKIIFSKLIKAFRELDISMSLDNGLDILQNIFDRYLIIEHLTFSTIKSEIKDDEIKLWTLEKYLKTLSSVGGILSTTIHQSKGLEFDAVILNQVNIGKIPHQIWNPQIKEHEELTIENLEDGKKVFYVGVSRARKYLIMLHNWKPSMFVRELESKGHFY
jgi:superfamily I DNA/RNA helicase